MDEDYGMMMEGMQDMPRSEMPQDGNPYSSLPQGIPPPNMPSVGPLPPQGGMPPYNGRGEEHFNGMPMPPEGLPPYNGKGEESLPTKPVVPFLPGGKPDMDPNALQDFIGKLLQHGQGRRTEDLLDQNRQQMMPQQEELKTMQQRMEPIQDDGPRQRVISPEELMRSYYEKRQPGAPDQAAEMVRNLMGRRV